MIDKIIDSNCLFEISSPYKLMIYANWCWFFNIDWIVWPKFKIFQTFYLFKIDIGVFCDILNKNESTIIKFIFRIYSPCKIGYQISVKAFFSDTFLNFDEFKSASWRDNKLKQLLYHF